jgi:signal transduction histidine kinase
MCALPSPVVEYLGKFIAETSSPGYFLVDKQGHLQEWGGALAAYGLRDLRAGAPIQEQVDFLVGLLPGADTALYCPCVDMGSGLFTDMHVFPGDGDDWVLLLDVSTEARQHRQLQQRLHDLSLLQEQQTKSLWQQVIAEVFLNLDQFLRDVLMDASLLADVCAALRILVLERLQNGSYRVIGSIPEWFMRMHSEAIPEEGDVQPGRMFPFLANFLLDAEAFWGDEAVGVLKSGPWRELDRSANELYLEASAVLWGTGKFLLIANSENDYEEKRSIIQRARENNLQQHRFGKEVQRKETLVQAIVHDVIGMLTPIKACFALLSSENLSPKARRCVELGLQQTTRQQMLTQTILDVFSAEMGALDPFTRDPTQAPDVVVCAKAVLKALSPVAATRQMTLQLHPSIGPQRDRKVVGERSRLERVIFNLVENAIRHSPGGAVVTVGMKSEGESILITVDDEGSYVPQDMVGALFEKLIQHRGRSGRAGLGLYFCRLMVERWGGTIGYSPRPRGGNRFWLRLPRASAHR